MAQEGPLGARRQEAHNVVADAGEVLHLGLGEVGRRDVPEAPLVGLLLGYIVAPHLVVVSTKTSSSPSMAMKSMLSDPYAQPSFRTSMPLCFKYERIASCDLSSMLFPWLSASSCWGPPPWRALWCGWCLRKSGSARGKSEPQVSLRFLRCACGSRKSFTALARERLWVSLRSQDETR